MSFIKKETKEEIKKLSNNTNTIREKALKEKSANEADYNKKKDVLLFGSNVEIIQNYIEKAYLPVISAKYSPVDISSAKFSYSSRVRILQVKKWVTDSKENSLDKLSNVYSALSNVECSIALIYRRTKDGVKVYFVITNQSDKIDPAVVDGYFDIFTSALKGNFPGVEIEEIEDFGSYDTAEDKSVVGEWFSETNSNAVAMVTNIASESSEKFISQGIEKLLDGVVPTDSDTEYTLMLLAEPMTKDEIRSQKSLYEGMYTQLSPFETVQQSINISTAQNETKNLTKGISKSNGKSISFVNFGKSQSINYGFTSGETTTSGESFSSSKTNYRVKESLKTIETHIKRLQLGSAMGMWKFASYVLADSFSIAQNVSSMYRSLTEGEESFIESAAINIWNDNRSECKKSIDVIQNYLRAFTHPVFALNGLEKFENRQADEYSVMLEEDEDLRENITAFPDIADGFTLVSGQELSMSMNLPNSAVSGLPVIECAEFGRDVISQSYGYGKNQGINIGNIFHMQQEEINKPIILDSKSMTEHTFITGSTGAGKSTTVYRILAEASKLSAGENKNVTFMVVEPAKGEYKNELFRISDKPVYVYGTNPKSEDSELLRINPFAFPTGKIHILEHLDRLIEIFNVCWPMYAAMPAVLKKGIEEAYKACGWDLLESENTVSNDLFPTFADVCNNIKTVIDKSDYSADNKGDYKGALVTRLESLTNGINGLIFTADDIKDEVLFENNTIVDLSRVGSTETKALIMGLLVMKLQEYRMASDEKPNASLKHITVLEEAHNLLKRTSTEQSAEGSNLLGKSVEMLANSIAEMRTYGEGFIIADQAPGLLDMSVIRNTNTKIIMRLPDYSDRELVGKAANLNDDQIVEIAKLRPGVAAVYYNGWINPVLCKIPTPPVGERKTVKPANANIKKTSFNDNNLKKKVIEDLIYKDKPEDLHKFTKELTLCGYSGEFISKFNQFCLVDNSLKNKLLPSLFYLFFNPSSVIKDINAVTDMENVVRKLSDELEFTELGISGRDAQTVVLNLLYEHNLRNAGFEKSYLQFSNHYKNKYNMKGV